MRVLLCLFFIFFIVRPICAENAILLFDQEVKTPFLPSKAVLLVEKKPGEIIRFQAKAVRLSALADSQGLYENILGALAGKKEIQYSSNARYSFAFEISNEEGRFWVSPIVRVLGRDLLVKSKLEESWEKKINILRVRVEKARNIFHKQLDHWNEELSKISDPLERKKIAARIKDITLGTREDSLEYFIELLKFARKESSKENFRKTWHEMANYYEKMLIKNASVYDVFQEGLVEDLPFDVPEDYDELMKLTSGVSKSDLKAELKKLHNLLKKKTGFSFAKSR